MSVYNGATQWRRIRVVGVQWYYAASQTPACLVLMFLLIKPRDLLAFGLILFALKFKLVDKSTPRYLAEDTLSRAFQERLTDFAICLNR